MFGCGGISAIQGARIAGAAEILAVDTLEGKLEQAKHFGATSVTTPDGFDDAKGKLTGGEGFDFALECIGNPATIRATYDAARNGGTAVIVGVGRMEQMVQFSAFELFYANKTLKGSMYGSANVRTFTPSCCRSGRRASSISSMISRRIKLEEVNDAFRAMGVVMELSTSSPVKPVAGTSPGRSRLGGRRACRARVDEVASGEIVRDASLIEARRFFMGSGRGSGARTAMRISGSSWIARTQCTTRGIRGAALGAHVRGRRDRRRCGRVPGGDGL